MESLEINRQFWQGKKVLITGNTGFKGSWLSLWLSRLGAEISGYSISIPTSPSLYQLADVESIVDQYWGDIGDLATLDRVVEQSRPEVIFHLAAQSLVKESYQEPLVTFKTNVMGTVNILEVARNNESVRTLVNVTSDKCYENREWSWGYRENEAMGGHDPYSSSKACSELVTAAYRHSFFGPKAQSGKVAVATVRAGNVIGGGDWAPDRLVVDAVKAFADEQPLQIRNRSAVRPWQHVLEPLRGYLLIAQGLDCEGDKYAEGWNFGPSSDDEKSVAWVADYLTALWGNRAHWKQDPESHPHEAQSLTLDCAKARARIGWKPQISIETALKWTVEWYKQWSLEGEMLSLSLEQIERYENLLKHG